jgi:hypothetical protein
MKNNTKPELENRRIDFRDIFQQDKLHGLYLTGALCKHYAKKAYEGVDVQIHAFLTSALVHVDDTKRNG